MLQLNANKSFSKETRQVAGGKPSLMFNYCKLHSDALKRRHDAIQNCGCLLFHLLAPGLLTRNFGDRPTLIPMVLNEEVRWRIYHDFTVAFGDRSIFFLPLRRQNRQVPAETREGKVAHADAIVVGSLGSWDPSEW
ncbi:hypothetical protein NPIL_161881 [Nephila pilipes]|uniref:Uncharacterized protein n=1 Tax=Nephila pilipes TaxID=299642 RepID=A0A8X6N1P9_NEPPI|nr:hypothetical protein NPIL_161881 [Nephila pilipes]